MQTTSANKITELVIGKPIRTSLARIRVGFSKHQFDFDNKFQSKLMSYMSENFHSGMPVTELFDVAPMLPHMGLDDTLRVIAAGCELRDNLTVSLNILQRIKTKILHPHSIDFFHLMRACVLHNAPFQGRIERAHEMAVNASIESEIVVINQVGEYPRPLYDNKTIAAARAVAAAPNAWFCAMQSALAVDTENTAAHKEERDAQLKILMQVLVHGVGGLGRCGTVVMDEYDHVVDDSKGVTKPV